MTFYCSPPPLLVQCRTDGTVYQVPTSYRVIPSVVVGEGDEDQVIPACTRSPFNSRCTFVICVVSTVCTTIAACLLPSLSMHCTRNIPQAPLRSISSVQTTPTLNDFPFPVSDCGHPNRAHDALLCPCLTHVRIVLWLYKTSSHGALVLSLPRTNTKPRHTNVFPSLLSLLHSPAQFRVTHPFHPRPMLSYRFSQSSSVSDCCCCCDTNKEHFQI